MELPHHSEVEKEIKPGEKFKKRFEDLFLMRYDTAGMQVLQLLAYMLAGMFLGGFLCGLGYLIFK